MKAKVSSIKYTLTLHVYFEFVEDELLYSRVIRWTGLIMESTQFKVNAKIKVIHIHLCAALGHIWFDLSESGSIR